MTRRLEAARSAAERVGEAPRDAEARVAAAKAAAADASDAHAEALLAGQTALMDRPMRRVRDEEEAAEDDIAAARGALAKVEAAIADHERAQEYAARRVETAVGELMSTAIDSVIERAEALRRELEGEHAVLRFLAHVSPSNEAAYRANMALPSTPPGEVSPNYSSHPALTPWAGGA